MKKHIRIKAASCLDMIHAINSKISELDPNYVSGVDAATCNSDGKQEIKADDIIDTYIDEAYVDEMMQYVADETASLDPPAVCTWHVDGDILTFVVTGIEDDRIDEYSCPLTDLTGDVESDVAYIADAINGGVEEVY